MLVAGAASLWVMALPGLARAAGPAPASGEAAVAVTSLVSGVLALVMIAGLVLRAAGIAVGPMARDGARILACAAAAMLAFGLFGQGLMTPDDWIIAAPASGSGGTPRGILGAPAPDGFHAQAGAVLFFRVSLAGFLAAATAIALASRLRDLPVLVFAAGLGGLLLPVAGSWTWGGGFLAVAGFRDLAGATLVHSLAGWCALTGLVVLERAGVGGAARAPAASHALVLAGTLALWAGWSGSLAGAVAATGDLDGLAAALANGALAGAAGLLAGYLAGLLAGLPGDITAGGAPGGRGAASWGPAGLLAGLVAISADPVFPTLSEAALIGAAGVPVAALAGTLLRRVGAVDPSGLVGVLLGAGIFGTLAAAGTDPAATLAGQVRGVVMTGGFAVLASTALWVILNGLLGLAAGAADPAAPASPQPAALPGTD